jgi:DNA-binding MarR family transcriptional regulator
VTETDHPASGGDALALEHQVCFALSVAARNVVAVYRPFLEPMGLTHPQYLVMLALWQHGQLSVKALSGLLQLDPGTLSPLIKRLEVAGLVRRNRDPRDERALAIALTEQGRELRTRAELIPWGIVERLDMDLAELTALREALTRMIGASQRALERPPAMPVASAGTAATA